MLPFVSFCNTVQEMADSKRTRVLSKKTSHSSITVREYHEKGKKRIYTSFMVQGWKENDVWQRKKFKNREDADRFASAKRIELENKGRKQQFLLTPLTEEQSAEAVKAFDKLGDTYTLAEAVDYFLQNHRAPEFTISLSNATKEYSEERERQGIRYRTVRQSVSVLKQFSKHVRDIQVHEVTAAQIKKFLVSLRAKDGVSPAKRKTWNNYRNDLRLFFDWAGESDLATQRPWVFTNPAEEIKTFSAKQIAEQKPEILTTSIEDVTRLFSVLMRWRGGVMVKPLALCYFAGIRPEGELKRLAEDADKLINLKTGIINIPPSVSKTAEKRLSLIHI